MGGFPQDRARRRRHRLAQAACPTDPTAGLRRSVRASTRKLRDAAALAIPPLVRPPLRPTPEQLAPLSRMERIAFRVADALARPELSAFSGAYNTVTMGALIWSCGGRRFQVKGLEVFDGLGPKDSVLLVANHRSFFDFFSITAILYWRTRLTRRIFFPVRGTFFYDHPLGPAVNMAMSGMRMFPPVMRDAQKRIFNQYSVERCIDELERDDIGTLMGIHPEGTRNKGPDPYALLPAQLGVGRIALGARRAKVVPVFVLGMGQSILGEMKMNALAPEQHRIDMCFGAPIDFSDLWATAHQRGTQKKAAVRCLDAIAALGEEQRRASSGWAPLPPEDEAQPASVLRARTTGDAARASTGS